MKKLTYLQILMFAGLSIGSLNNIYSCSKCGGQEVVVFETNEMSPIPTMKSLEDQIHQIRQDVKKSGDAALAFTQLDEVSALVPAVVAKLRVNDGGKDGHMWRVHEHTLNRKVQEARDYAADHAE